MKGGGVLRIFEPEEVWEIVHQAEHERGANEAEREQGDDPAERERSANPAERERSANDAERQRSAGELSPRSPAAGALKKTGGEPERTRGVGVAAVGEGEPQAFETSGGLLRLFEPEQVWEIVHEAERERGNEERFRIFPVDPRRPRAGDPESGFRQHPRAPRGSALQQPVSSSSWAYPAELGGTGAAPPRAIDDELPVHPLPEARPARKGPFSISIVAHLVVIALVLARATWLAAHVTAPDKAAESGLTIALQPQAEPQPRKPPIRPPVVPRTPEPAPRPHKPAPEVSIKPPDIHDIPPPTPLPPPTRMGELVPVPHYPVPGKVPPEETKTGKAGAPGPKADEMPQGSPNGDNNTDPGAGALRGKGAPGHGDEPSRNNALVPPNDFGNIYTLRPRPGHGREGSGDKEGGGSRRGMDLRVTGADLGDFSFEDKDYDWADYYSQMYYAILRAWYNRLYLTTGNFERWSYQHGNSSLNGKVLVRFVIERSGAVSSIEVLEPSVMLPLDESARGALKEVILPRLPADFPKEREAVTGRFIIEGGDVGGFKQELIWWHGQQGSTVPQ